MKNLSKLLLALLITFSYTNTYSQNEHTPWQFSFGINGVDLNADKFLAVDENWNVSSGLSMFTLSKYL